MVASSVTESVPGQKDGWLGTMTGCGPEILTVTGADGGLGQPPTVSDTVYVPAVVTTIAWVVSLSLHRLPDDAEEVSVTLPPGQKVVGPDGVIVGAGGIGLTVTTIGAEG